MNLAAFSRYSCPGSRYWLPKPCPESRNSLPRVPVVTCLVSRLATSWRDEFPSRMNEGDKQQQTA